MDTSLELARFNMIQQQIRPWEVLDDRVLDVMGTIPREAFVPDAYRGLAYADIEIPHGEGQVMLAPKVVGRLLQALKVQPNDRVLEVGTGSGYLTACLSRLGAKVISLEVNSAVAAAARERLARLGFDRIEVRVADALDGPTKGGPFDVIAVTGSVPEIDALREVLRVLEDQLTVGGRLFCVIGEPPAMEAWLTTKVAGADLRRESLFETCIPALANCPAKPAFVF